MIVIGLLGILVLLGGAGLTFLGGLTSLFNTSIETIETAVMFSYAAGAVFLSLLLVPPIVLAIRRMSGKADEAQSDVSRNIFNRLHPKGLIWAYPFLLAAGYFLNQSEAVNWIFMPVINVITLAIPVAWLLWLGSKNFSPSSTQRNWSAFGVGMTVGPVMIFIIEIIVMLVGIVLIGVFLAAAFPNIEALLNDLITELQRTPVPQQIPQDAIAQFLQNPGVIALILLFVSGLVPLIEEVFKPVAVWLLWGRQLTLQDGWMLGMLSGAGFALVENLGNVAVGEGWLFVALARGGASALHIFNSALIGYTFVLARKRKRYLAPVLALAGTILIHALWNAVTIFATINGLSAAEEAGAPWSLGYVIVLVIMSALMIAGILVFNRKLAAERPDTGTEADVSALNPEIPAEVQLED
jgi:hypothetical protein